MTGWSGGSNPSLATTGRVGVTAISPGPQPGDCRFKSGTRHLGLIVYWLGFGPFKAAKTGRNLWGYGAVVPALPISRGLMAGQRTVNPSVEVRLLPREPWVLAQVVRAPGRQLGGHGFKSAPVVKRTSRLTTNQETGGSSPSGSAQARLAQWESTWSTPRGRRSDSFAEHGGYSSIGRALGCDPGGCQFDPG